MPQVKTRADADEDPLEAVDERKIAHMVRAAEAYLRGCDVPFGGVAWMKYRESVHRQAWSAVTTRSPAEPVNPLSQRRSCQ